MIKKLIRHVSDIQYLLIEYLSLADLAKFSQKAPHLFVVVLCAEVKGNDIPSLQCLGVDFHYYGLLCGKPYAPMRIAGLAELPQLKPVHQKPLRILIHKYQEWLLDIKRF